MKTSVTGFPRVGKLRELKFATEKYFRKEISADELRETAKNIRISQWLLQQKNNIDYIPSNDFSFYDGTLDTAVLFNIIPKKYADTELSALDTYFAMARGYQGENFNAAAALLIHPVQVFSRIWNLRFYFKQISIGCFSYFGSRSFGNSAGGKIRY